MKLYFVRHGKTKWNLEGRFQGANGDSPLLEEAKEELKELGYYLKDIAFDAVFSSDLKRAQNSAEILMSENRYPKEISCHKELREWQLGRLEGAKISTISAIYPHQMDAFRHNLAKFDASMFEAETIYETTHRVRRFIESLQGKDYDKVLIVGHGANLTAAIQSLLSFEPALLRSRGGLDNASLTVLETNDFKDFDCLVWNDKSYLAEVVKQK
ncbi:hypothetical protein HMPREF9318_00741 [Streptococcus urinalis FB127-CNA-2]|uniref:Phosphoglycerate mutase family protein n=1 Tax=Streptococcus urinalis 2285-97 TaxID=764291 RepID=G5KHI6_9STRE|nr:histidine phosphatase family protein [Streptococcus urinalis]EHJ56161.1 phosphoglycerate mutase family protein [Streptococcus urinalis 2285-97]EKS22543.1 hypothetical protein HMPREF9318_00741 [Streptococcus urinalis FB127-CNA-2]VEF32356.1 phosphoglycerate mutase [Streptococcus urinalis]